MSKTVRLINDATAILSMRESDFDAYSAYGEVIDNSIQASATNIRIRVCAKERSGTKGRPYSIIEKICFGDDGIGMPPEVLHQCLVLGYSTRYNDRSGIGRFGVGMTLAAINQCKRVEVYSKERDSSWHYTYIDLDELTSNPPKMESIPAPVIKTPPLDLVDLVGSERGTLVVWTKYDRQPISAERMIPEIRIWCGRTYRHFIWDGLKIFVDGIETAAIDPLYATTKSTKFPDDPAATVLPEMTIPWPVPEEGRGPESPPESNVRIRMSLLPNVFRPNQGSGGTQEVRDRHIDRNQGISIVRNRREVFYGAIPYWPGPSTWFSEIDRWWGCEIAFDAELDRAFTVKNIKRGAIPVPELKEAIYSQISPTRETCLGRVRSDWAEAKRIEREPKPGQQVLETGHGAAEKVAKKTPTDTGALDKGVDFATEAERLAGSLLRTVDAEDRAKWIAKWKSQPFSIHDSHWKGPEFFEANHLGGSDVLRYNLGHPFFEEVYRIIQTLETEDSEDVVLSRRLKIMIDLLIIAYSKAESKFEPETVFTAEDFVENFRINWGMYLKSYLQTWLNEERDYDE